MENILNNREWPLILRLLVVAPIKLALMLFASIIAITCELIDEPDTADNIMDYFFNL